MLTMLSFNLICPRVFQVDRKDIKNPYFTLSRILPISLHMEKTKVISTDKTYDKLHFDFKARYL